MTEGTAEDWAVIAHHNLTFATGLADRVLTHLRLLGGDTGGFAVDRLEHSLQTATRAYRANEDDEYVVCALLHDIGDTLGLVQPLRRRGGDRRAVRVRGEPLDGRQARRLPGLLLLPPRRPRPRRRATSTWVTPGTTARPRSATSTTSRRSTRPTTRCRSSTSSPPSASSWPAPAAASTWATAVSSWKLSHRARRTHHPCSGDLMPFSRWRRHAPGRQPRRPAPDEHQSARCPCRGRHRHTHRRPAAPCRRRRADTGRPRVRAGHRGLEPHDRTQPGGRRRRRQRRRRDRHGDVRGRARASGSACRPRATAAWPQSTACSS